MGLFGLTRAKTPPTLEAQLAPMVRSDTNAYFPTFAATLVTRAQAMSVPAIARCRNLIIGVAATAPLVLRKDDQELPAPLWLDQPCAAQASSVTMAWTYDSLFFYGVAYWRVIEVYADDGRPSRFEWVANTRVSMTFDKLMTRVEQYFVDGREVPMAGVGSLITFQSLDEGVLNRGAITIQAALDLTKAAQVAAATPMPAGVLKNNGADMDEQEIQGVLAAWRNARKNNSIAYVSSQFDFASDSFSPKDMMYVEAIQNMALECARVCNVDASYISAEHTRPMTYANVQDRRRDFVAETLQQFISAVEDRLSMDDLTPRGQKVRVDLDENFLRANAMDRLNVIEKLLALNLIDITTAQDMEDLAPTSTDNKMAQPVSERPVAPNVAESDTTEQGDEAITP